MNCALKDIRSIIFLLFPLHYVSLCPLTLLFRPYMVCYIKKNITEQSTLSMYRLCVYVRIHNNRAFVCHVRVSKRKPAALKNQKTNIQGDYL